MNAINYQKVMEELIRENCGEGRVPKLLLHSCCAPCSSYCISCLAEHFDVTVFYYNPNIYPPEEYRMRAQEQRRFIEQYPCGSHQTPVLTVHPQRLRTGD